jgi:hypothetical protein
MAQIQQALSIIMGSYFCGGQAARKLRLSNFSHDGRAKTVNSRKADNHPENAHKKCTRADQKKTKLFLPLLSADFYPDGNSPRESPGK